jgi:signal transduction histidine kinase
MKYPDRVRALQRQIRTFPLTWLSLSRGSRLFLVALSYGLGIVGLWLLFPPTHNGATMFLPVVSACWLFRYRGLLISLVLNGIAFQLTYIFLLQGMLPDQAFVEGAIIGFGTSLGLGLVVCWLRTTVDQVHLARQQTLAAEQEHLQTLLKERQATLAYEQQRKVNTLKDQFLLNVNHELRTPLTVLGGSLELLREFDERLDPMKRIQILEAALASHEDLVDMVDRVLDAAEFIGDAPVANVEAVNIRRLLQEVLAYLAPQDLAAYTICLQAPEQVIAWADPKFLRQILRNLFSNIFKYVPKQTKIHIEITQADPFSPVCLNIRDEGPGIPTDEIPLLFGKFVRLKRDLGGSTRGTGLGLYICKQLIEAMGGRIRIESSGRPGEGSCFCLTLPSVSPHQD